MRDPDMSTRLSPWLFIALFVAGLLIVPVANLLAPRTGQRHAWTDVTWLYNADVVERTANRLLTPAGISLQASELVIGRDQWLFLGDGYEDTITALRRPPTENDREEGRRVRAAMDAWQVDLAKHHVRLFKVLVGPNKTTVYPEHAARWMQPADPSVLDAFLQEAGSRYVDVRPSLRAAKQQVATPLYYRTDTHWNALGAGVAFRDFARQVAAEAPGLRWPDESIYRLRGVSPRAGGDLSGFLFLQAEMRDEEPRLALQDLDIPTRQTDFETGKLLHEGPNAEVPMSEVPILVNSPRALNAARVLWLRDSFGTALSPFMSYSFSDVLQLHWEVGLLPDRLAELVDRWQPDYVFITVVERDARAPLFAQPPSRAAERDSPGFGAEIVTTRQRLQDVAPDGGADGMRVTGKSPFVVYAVPAGRRPGNDWFLKLPLDCGRGGSGVPVRIAWTTRQQPRFDGTRGKRLVFHPERPLLALSELGITDAAGLARIRVQIIDTKACQSFRLSPPLLGRLP